MSTRRPYIRPGFALKTIVNPIVRRFGLAPTLSVAGRRSGKRIVVPMGEPLDFRGARYLVSGRGETQWVRNLRAVGHAEFRLHGQTQRFRAAEVTGPERDEALSAYRAKLGHSVDRYFREIPDPTDHPVFRMEAEEAAPRR